MILNPKFEYVFVAGDTGITPILAMMRDLKSQGHQKFRLIYCTRNAASAAHSDELTGAAFAPHVTLHHDHGDSNNAFDFWPVLKLRIILAR